MEQPGTISPFGLAIAGQGACVQALACAAAYSLSYAFLKTGKDFIPSALAA